MMSVSTSIEVKPACPNAKVFFPLNALNVIGPVWFRSQAARDFACLLDIDETVSSWACAPLLLAQGRQVHRPDFLVEFPYGSTVVDIIQAEPPKIWVREAALAKGYGYEAISVNDMPEIRLRNAKDLLRYAHHDVALGDRVRLLASLDENSSLTISEAMTVFREMNPIAGLACLTLQKFIWMNLDDQLIGPETIIRRKHD